MPATPSADLVGVLDVGKSSMKLSIVERSNGRLVHHVEARTPPPRGKRIRELDVKSIERWLVEGLTAAPSRDRITLLVPVAHGATAAFVSTDDDDQVLAVPDYECEEFEQVALEYRAQRDPFALTFSPWLPRGLNLGRQLYYLQQREPATMARVANVLLYPQYWAWRLSGVRASEITSLGCHTDLWRPAEHRCSHLALREGWDALLPQMGKADDILGFVRPELASATGLDRQCQVICGIHDSNASYLRHLSSRPADQPFAVVSSGTWTIVMARGADLGRLREEYDMLANVDAQGASVATARFMGGREYAQIAGAGGSQRMPTADALVALVHSDIMALPSFSETGGPFPGRPGRLIGAEQLDDTRRVALATLYCALMVDQLLDALGAKGDVIIDGPLAVNPLFPGVLAALRPDSTVLASVRGGGEVVAGAVLAGVAAPAGTREVVPVVASRDLHTYRNRWLEQMGIST